jgi:hypothetical protein
VSKKDSSNQPPALPNGYDEEDMNIDGRLMEACEEMEKETTF